MTTSPRLGCASSIATRVGSLVALDTESRMTPPRLGRTSITSSSPSWREVPELGGLGQRGPHGGHRVMQRLAAAIARLRGGAPRRLRRWAGSSPPRRRPVPGAAAAPARRQTGTAPRASASCRCGRSPGRSCACTAVTFQFGSSLSGKRFCPTLGASPSPSTAIDFSARNAVCAAQRGGGILDQLTLGRCAGARQGRQRGGEHEQDGDATRHGALLEWMRTGAILAARTSSEGG